MFLSKRTILAISLGGLLFPFQAAWAETQSSQSIQSQNLEDVHVRAQRRYNSLATEQNADYTTSAVTVGTKIPASLSEIPQSISLITQQQIRDRNSQTFDQLARKINGLRVLSNDDGRSSVYARGYEYDEYNVDGLPAPMQSINGTLPNLIAFDRVEVMRGANGLFDSTGEMGGIVNFVRKRPTQHFQGNVNLGYGTEKQYQIDGDVSGSLNRSGTVTGRLVAQTMGKSPEPAKKNHHHETIYGAVDWHINPKTTLGLGYLYQHRQITPNNGLPTTTKLDLLPLPDNTFVGANWNNFTSKSHDVFADLKHYFDNKAYGKIALRYSDRNALSNYAFGTGINPTTKILTATGLGTDVQQRSLSGDMSYSRSFLWNEKPQEFVIGADFNRFKTRNEQGRARLNNVHYQQFNTLPETDILAKARAKTKNYTHSLSEENLNEAGIYGKLVVRPVHDLALIVGGRLGHYHLTTSDGKTTQSASKNPLTGYAGTVWDWSPNHHLYASYSMLHRPQTALDTNNQLLKARQGQQTEIGYKGNHFNDKLNTRLTLYRLRDKNAAAAIVGDNAHYTALGKRIMQGWEAEISGAINDKWQIHAGYHYLSSKIKTASTTRDDGIFLLMPKHSANIWTSYQPTEKLTLGAGMNAVSHFSSSAGIRAGGYATFDAMAAYQFTPKLKAQINVDNLFNRHYYTRVGSAGTFNMVGSKRSVMANVRYDF